MVDAGMRAILVCGTTGEPWTLSEAEQAGLVDAVVAAVNGRVPVIAGVRGDDAVERAIYADGGGVDAILALSPPQHLHAYYDDIAAVGPPVLAYHFPAVSPPGIPVEELPRLPVVGVKDSGGDVERLKREVRVWDQPVYTGAARILVIAAREGAAGALLSIANLEPGLSIAAFAGDEDAQSRLESMEISVLKRHMSERFGTSPTVRT